MKANAYVFAAVKEMQVVDDYTIRIVTKYPTPMDKIVGAGYGAFIMSPTMADKAPEWFAAGNGIGTGPYKFESFEPGQRLILTRNEDYWGGWTEGQFTTVVWTIAEDPAVRESMIRAGEADITWNIPFDNHESLNATGEVKAFGAPAFFDLYLHFRGDRPPFDDVRVRQAFSYAFPYEEVQAGTFGGNATVAKGAVPRLMWTPPVETTTYSFDLEKARALLQEAGVAQPLAVRLGLSTGNADTMQVAELWRAQLAQIGVEMEIQPMALGAWWDEVYSADPTIDIILQNMWPGMDSPSEFLCAVFDSNLTFFPFAAFNSPEYNLICEGALQLEATDPAQADVEYQQAEQMLVDQAIAVFALDLPWNWAVRTDIQGLVPNPLYLDVVFWHDLSR
jgi:peptide/nickel transport system substrate-binding protein